MRKLLFLFVSFVASIAAAAVAVADPIDDAIKARQSYYQVVKFNAGPLFGMAKGAVPYDAKAAQTNADNLKALAAMTNGAMWPQGSDNKAKAGKTRALPAIWETYPAVLDKSKAWKDAIAALAEAAGGGLDKLRPAVAALGKSCAGCHDEYRAKNF